MPFFTLFTLSLVLVASSAAVQAGGTVRVAVDSAGAQGNSGSFVPSLSATGRWVAFASGATNLVAGDTNAATDIFVHDRKTGETVRVSVDSAGIEGNGDSSGPSISATGRWVAFQSFATNLVAGDTNEASDVFVHDRRTGQTVRVSMDSAGVQGNDTSSDPSISANGRWVAFQSFATNLVAGDTNGDRDIFVHDLTTGETVRVSVNSAGIQGNSESFFASLSAKGRVVAFTSDASNLVAEDTNGDSDVFVHYRK